MRRTLGVAISFALAATLSLGVTGPVSAATTFVVDDDGMAIVGNCDDTTATTSTISAAVGLASAGDTIEVCPGTYSELVNVNKGLTLSGAQAGVDARTRGVVDESIVNGNAGTTAFYVTADNVTIDGFTVKDQTNVNQFGAGIFLGAGTSHATIANNIVTNNVVGLFLANDNAIGQTVIEQNLFDSNNQPGSASGHGIYTDQFVAGGTVANVAIKDNVFKGNDGQGIGFSSTSAAAPATGITILDNAFDSNGRGLYAFNLTDSIVTGNMFTNATESSTADIRIFEGVDGLTISNNVLEDGSGRAYRASNSGTGSAGPTDVHLKRNSITGYSGPDGVVQNDAGLAMLDAECNWWGSATGPTTSDVEGDVDADPYLGTENLQGPCPPDDAGPITMNTTSTPNPIAISAAGTITAHVDDSTTGGSNIAFAEYSLDGGTTWKPMAAIDNAFDEVSEDVTASFLAPTSPGIVDLCVHGTDAAGNLGNAQCIMLVVYDPSGGFVTGGGWLESPPGAALVQPVWQQGFEADTAGWLDASSGWAGTVTRVPSGTDGIPSSTGGSHAVMEGDVNWDAPFSRFDGYRSVWPGMWVAEIDVYLDPAWVAGTGFDYSVAATGSDGLHQRDFIFHVTKDTSTSDLLVAGSNNTNFAPREDLENINHYEVTTAGWYTLQHVFRDQGGSLAVDLNLLDVSGTVLFTETRFNAADTIPAEVGGNRYSWFTFINLTGGIAVDDHELLISPTGLANFGFVSKYKKGATVPDGSSEFQFQAGDLNFHSASYDWLVVNKASQNAQFKGTGTINGSGNYGFMIWAADGTPDLFRIKIWDKDNGDAVVYDNGVAQPIGGGSIVVHTK